MAAIPALQRLPTSSSWNALDCGSYALAQQEVCEAFGLTTRRRMLPMAVMAS